jgi:hypothetical protein
MGLGLIQPTSVAATGSGTITVLSCNRRVVLRPRIEDGRTEILEVAEIDYPIGTSLRVEIDPAYPADQYALDWASEAIQLARYSREPYRGRPSVHWFDADAFWSLLHAVTPEMKLRDFLGRFDGCSTRRIQEKILSRFGAKRLCSALSRPDAPELLSLLQKNTAPVRTARLGALGPGAWFGYDGYAILRDSFAHGARSPLATIPVIVECWASVEPDGSENHDVTITKFSINRSPSTGYHQAQRIRGRQVAIVINQRRIDVSLPKLEVSFALSLTVPHMPVLSGGKLADITPFARAIGHAVTQAVTRAQRSARRQSSRPKASAKDEDKHQSGKLHRILEASAERESCDADELTVLSKGKDPYRLDTAAGHRLGRWCAALIQRFLAPEARIHLRGFHYVLASAADVTRPDGSRYVNSDAMWEWFSDIAMKAARWLGYVPFERIVDERNAAPELYLPLRSEVEPERSNGEQIIIPGADKAMPGFTSSPWPVVQSYRIILIAEKVSLRPVLLPIAREVGGELLLPTGEPSDTMIAELAARCASDSRPSVVLYSSDFDPS